MNAKTLFMQNKDLAPFWNTTAHDSKFEYVLAFARAEFLETQPTQEEIRGAERFIRLLQTLGENEPEGTGELPSPGLHHQIDKLPPKPQTSS